MTVLVMFLVGRNRIMTPPENVLGFQVLPIGLMSLPNRRSYKFLPLINEFVIILFTAKPSPLRLLSFELCFVSLEVFGERPWYDKG